MTTFYMVRHGEPDWLANEKYKFKGHGRDLVPLTNKGRNQAKDTAIVLKNKKAEVIIVSPYTRSMQTAAILSKELGLEMIVEVDLREWQPDLTYEYQTYEEFIQLCEEYEKYKGEYPIGDKKKWETKTILKSRVDEVLKRYLNYKEVIVVAHEMVIKTQVDNGIVNHCELIEYIK